MTYAIVERGRAIKCLTCGMTSWSPSDVKFRYCGNCEVFHDDAEAYKEWLLRAADNIDIEQHLLDALGGSPFVRIEFSGRDPEGG